MNLRMLANDENTRIGEPRPDLQVIIERAVSGIDYVEDYNDNSSTVISKLETRPIVLATDSGCIVTIPP